MYGFPMMNYQPFYPYFYPNYTFPQYDPFQPQIAQNQYDSITNSNNIQNIQKPKLSLTNGDLEKYGFGIQKKHWSKQEDDDLRRYAQLLNCDWKQVAKMLPGRNQKMCYSRYRRSEQDIKVYWSKTEDQAIKKYFQGQKLSWKTISQYFPNRTSKQIRQHYLNFLRPNIKIQAWTIQEDIKIVSLFNEYGKKWKLFQSYIEGRTQNQIKNRYYGRLKRLDQKKNQVEQNQDTL